MTEGDAAVRPCNVTNDGSSVVTAPETNPQPPIDTSPVPLPPEAHVARELWLHPLAGTAMPRRLFRADRPRVWCGELSPDGRWLAYDSSEFGDVEIVVRPFPDVEAGRWRLSENGGEFPVWAKDGRELFYWSRRDGLMAIAIDGRGPALMHGPPVPLFHIPGGAWGRTFDVAPNGKWFLVLRAEIDPPVSPREPKIVVVDHWADELGR